MIDAVFQRFFVYLAEMTCVTIEAQQHLSDSIWFMWKYLIHFPHKSTAWPQTCPKRKKRKKEHGKKKSHQNQDGIYHQFKYYWVSNDLKARVQVSIL